jgi:SAM-dependent methyltransferase
VLPVSRRRDPALRPPGPGEERTRRVEQTLTLPTVHEMWDEAYYGGESGPGRGNHAFYERAFDEIVGFFGPARDGVLLDAGCGQGHQAIRLAKRGFEVEAVDLSPAVLRIAARNVEQAGLADAIHLQRENLLDLSFAAESFRHVLCWGVLMHVPRLSDAIRQLARVLEPGGIAVLSESNQRSLDTIAARLRDQMRGRSTRWTAGPAGIEVWSQTPAGALMARKTDIRWLIRECERAGLELQRRCAGEFTETYTISRDGALTKGIHTFNLLWFERVRTGRLAAGNILVFRKR